MHPILALIIAVLTTLALAWIIKHTWWRVWYPVSIAVLGFIIKYRERKARG